jgi:hypothetical protein
LSLSNDAEALARTYVTSAGAVWALVIDNINFTLRAYSERVDSGTVQLNETTAALFVLPKSYTYEKYASVLKVAPTPSNLPRLTASSLDLTPEQMQTVKSAFKSLITYIVLQYAPGWRHRKQKVLRPLWKLARKLKPKIRILEHDKTQFFPLKALDEEEASIAGTIRVVETLFVKSLDMPKEVAARIMRFVVGDWLTVRNLRLMKEEREDELSEFAKLNWVAETPMPFHFQLNGVYKIMRTHIGHPNDNNPSSLDHQRRLLRRAQLDPKKPEYNKAKELIRHSAIARILDCAR